MKNEKCIVCNNDCNDSNDILCDSCKKDVKDFSVSHDKAMNEINDLKKLK